MCRKAGILILILTGSIFFASCSLRKPSVTSVTTIKPLGDTMKVNDGSLIYALPMTVFNITVEFQHTIEKPGPYARYATDMLGIKDIISRESEKWAISKICVPTRSPLRKW